MHPIDAKYRAAPNPKAQLAELMGLKHSPAGVKRVKLHGPAARCTLTLTLPLPPYILSANSRVDWRRQLSPKKKYHAAAANALALQRAPQTLFDDCRADLVVYSPQAARHDRDNIIGRCKALFDALTRYGVLRDDLGLTIGEVLRVKDQAQRVIVTLTG